jgi:hypothetical protein
MTPTMSDGPQRARGFVRRWLEGPLWWLLPFLGFLLVFVVLLAVAELFPGVLPFTYAPR